MIRPLVVRPTPTLWVFLTSVLLYSAFVTLGPGTARAEPTETNPGQFFPVTEPITDEVGAQIRAATKELIDRCAANGVEPTLVFEFRPGEELPASENGDWVLHLGRVLYDHGTLMQAGPSLAGLALQPAVYLHPGDAERLGVAPGDAVNLVGSTGQAQLPVALDDSLEQGTVYLPFNLGVSVGNGVPVSVEVVS